MFCTRLVGFPDPGDLSFPRNGVVLDSSGNVYGTATAGGLPEGGGGVLNHFSPEWFVDGIFALPLRGEDAV